MKTRSNMPLFVVECNNVKTLSNAQIDLLRCGDYLVKKDASGEHAYKVTFKSDTGMCLTYHDASVIETQSYDKVNGQWVYNSEDKTPNLLDAQTEDDVEGIVEDLVEGGTLDNAKPIYFHPITLSNYDPGSQAYLSLFILNNSPDAFTKETLISFIKSLDVARFPLTGAIILAGNVYFSPAFAFWTGTVLCISGVDASAVVHTSATNVVNFEDIINDEDTALYDGVNKIN